VVFWSAHDQGRPDTIHADTQGHALPVYALAHLCGFELMP